MELNLETITRLITSTLSGNSHFRFGDSENQINLEINENGYSFEAKVPNVLDISVNSQPEREKLVKYLGEYAIDIDSMNSYDIKQLKSYLREYIEKNGDLFLEFTRKVMMNGKFPYDEFEKNFSKEEKSRFSTYWLLKDDK